MDLGQLSNRKSFDNGNMGQNRKTRKVAVSVVPALTKFGLPKKIMGLKNWTTCLSACGLCSGTCFQRMECGKRGEGSNQTAEEPDQHYLSPLPGLTLSVTCHDDTIFP